MTQNSLHTPAEDMPLSGRNRPGSSRSHLKTRVLVVEDEQDIAGLIKHTLERGGDIEVHVVSAAATPRSRRRPSSHPI